MDHQPEIGSILMIQSLQQLRLTKTGRKMAGLLRGDIPVHSGFILQNLGFSHDVENHCADRRYLVAVKRTILDKPEDNGLEVLMAFAPKTYWQFDNSRGCRETSEFERRIRTAIDSGDWSKVKLPPVAFGLRGGDFLPGFKRSEVEIARLSLESMTNGDAAASPSTWRDSQGSLDGEQEIVGVRNFVTVSSPFYPDLESWYDPCVST
jgi:hypothetical protein